MVMPGDNVAIEVELITPVAMEKTIRFAIREGGKTVGAGRVSRNSGLIIFLCLTTWWMLRGRGRFRGGKRKSLLTPVAQLVE